MPTPLPTPFRAVTSLDGEILTTIRRERVQPATQRNNEVVASGRIASGLPPLRNAAITGRGPGSDCAVRNVIDTTPIRTGLISGASDIGGDA